MSGRQIIYLVLAIAGAVFTWYHNLQYMIANDWVFSISDFIAGGMANPAAASLTMDIGIAAVAGFVWIIFEAQRLGMKHYWVYLVLGASVAFAFAFPLFLFMRERHLSREDDMGEGALA